MLINKDELVRRLRSGEIPDLDALNGVLRGMIKEVVEAAMGAELTFLAMRKTNLLKKTTAIAVTATAKRR